MSSGTSYFQKKLRLATFAFRRIPRLGLRKALRLVKDRAVGYTALELSQQLPEQADIVVDVGAHRGVVSEALGLVLRSKRLISVEPFPQHHAELMSRLGRLKGFELVPEALSDAAGEVVFHAHEFDAASSMFVAQPGHLEKFGFSGASRDITVKTTTLAALMAAKHLPHIDLLKLDCQGAELAVLKGAGDRIGDVRAIFVEVSFEPVYLQAPLFPEVHQWLNDHGFTLVRMENFAGAKGRTQWADALYLRHPST